MNEEKAKHKLDLMQKKVQHLQDDIHRKETQISAQVRKISQQKTRLQKAYSKIGKLQQAKEQLSAYSDEVCCQLKNLNEILSKQWEQDTANRKALRKHLKPGEKPAIDIGDDEMEIEEGGEEEEVAESTNGSAGIASPIPSPVKTKLHSPAASNNQEGAEFMLTQDPEAANQTEAQQEEVHEEEQISSSNIFEEDVPDISGTVQREDPNITSKNKTSLQEHEAIASNNKPSVKKGLIRRMSTSDETSMFINAPEIPAADTSSDKKAVGQSKEDKERGSKTSSRKKPVERHVTMMLPGEGSPGAQNMDDVDDGNDDGVHDQGINIGNNNGTSGDVEEGAELEGVVVDDDETTFMKVQEEADDSIMGKSHLLDEISRGGEDGKECNDDGKKNKGAAGEERTAGAVSASCMEEQNDFSGDDDDDTHNRSDAQTRGFNNLAGQSFWFDSEANSP